MAKAEASVEELVGMIERGDGARLAIKPLQVRWVFRLRRGQHLDRNQPVHSQMFAQENAPHAAFADALQQAVFFAENKPVPAAKQQLLRLERELLQEEEARCRELDAQLGAWASATAAAGSLAWRAATPSANRTVAISRPAAHCSCNMTTPVALSASSTDTPRH